MAVTRIIEMFSITHAQVLDGSTNALDVLTSDTSWGDIYGVNDASLDPNTDQFDNNGDDVTLSNWNWLNFATLQVKSGYMSFELISGITGVAYTSSGTGDDTFFRAPLWTAASMNVATRPVLLRTASKDHAGAVRTADLLLYKVQFGPMTFDGPRYKDGVKVNLAGRCLYSSLNEVGATFSDGQGQRVGEIISRPQA